MSDYIKNPPLRETELLPDPFDQLEHWLREAGQAGMIEPNSMTLATVGPDGRPSARIMLFKGVHDGGLTFYTNYRARKGRELAANPNVALVFWWDVIEKQVRVEGRVEKLPPELSQHYFHQRPRSSQLGAVTSRQSERVSSREELEQRLAENARKYEGTTVPCPAHWGGYRVVPERFEFWAGRPNRLHDRLVYRRSDRGWLVERLEP